MCHSLQKVGGRFFWSWELFFVVFGFVVQFKGCVSRVVFHSRAELSDFAGWSGVEGFLMDYMTC